MKTKEIIFSILGIIVIGGAIFFATRQNANAPIVDKMSVNADALSIAIEGYTFSPASLTIKKGATVKWTNNDSVPHVVAGDDSAWVSGPTMKQGDIYIHTFDTVGTFAYHCVIHPGMHGTIIVTE